MTPTNSKTAAPNTVPSAALQEASRDAAYRAYRGGRAVAYPLPALGALRLTGADRLDFIQGQVTCDVKALGVGETAEGLMLNHKGHALAQLRVVRRSEDLYLAVEGGAGDLVAAELERHIVFDAVEVEDVSRELAAWSIQGVPAAVAAALDALGAAVPAAGTSASVSFDDAKLLIVPAHRSGAGGVHVHMLVRHGAAVVARLAETGTVVAPPETGDLLRVVAGTPHAEREGGEGVLPQEAGLDPLVSYRKGCYLGQEIMARIEARGTLRRGLAGVELEGEPAAEDLIFEGRRVGRLGTVAAHPERGWIALAVVRNDLPDHAGLHVGGIRARLTRLPFEDAPA